MKYLSRNNMSENLPLLAKAGVKVPYFLDLEGYRFGL